jgi:hypothetical protein
MTPIGYLTGHRRDEDRSHVGGDCHRDMIMFELFLTPTESTR